VSLAEKKYVLESTGETERLERQSRMRAFDFKLELQHLKITEGQNILDAGCGSGIVADHLSRCGPGIHVTGWDFSKDRIEAAKEKYAAPNIEFAQKDLLKIGPQDGSYDTVICRYVLHHFNQADARKVIQNLLAVLNPGGTLYCINGEGLFNDIFPSSPFLRRCLAKIRASKDLDFQAARKIPPIFVEYGLQNVDWHGLISEFKGDELSQEIENLKQSLRSARPFIQKQLRSAATLERFQEEYFAALQAPGCVHFYNKFIAIGIKPRTGPRRLQLLRLTD
jgi:ubiquinone/menaquinone biosynthesis C-methylase UbiE